MLVVNLGIGVLSLGIFVAMAATGQFAAGVGGALGTQLFYGVLGGHLYSRGASKKSRQQFALEGREAAKLEARTKQLESQRNFG